MMNKQVAKNKNHVNEVYNNNPRQKFEPKKEKNLDNLKEIDDINTDVFNIQDDILNEIKFDDKIDINDYNNSNTESLNIKDTDKNTNNNINSEEDNNSIDDFTSIRNSNLSSTQKDKSSFIIPSLGRNQFLNSINNNNQGNKVFRPRISSLKRKLSTSIQNSNNIEQQPCLLRTGSTIKKYINNTNTNSQKDPYDELKEMYSKKILKKVMMSIVFTNININLSKMRNDSLSLEAKVLSFNILDHNFVFSIANADNSSLLLSLFEKRFNDDTFQIEKMTFQNEQEAFETIMKKIGE